MLPSQISVVGAGSWGTALSILICNNIKRVLLWGRDANQIALLDSQRENHKYLGSVTFPHNLAVTSHLANTVDDELCFLIVTPSHSFRQILNDLKHAILVAEKQPSDATIIWATKGFDTKNAELLSEVCTDVFGQSEKQGIVSGPSFALETARGLPTALTVACVSHEVAKSISDWFRTESTRVYFTDDPIGVQIGGAIKNVMAMAAGISDGLGYGANARAALITRGLSEMCRLGLALGGKTETFMGLTGVGDLILSCTDDQSRNRRFGLGLGQGKPTDRVIQDIGQEIEGIHTVNALYHLSQNRKVDMPITEQVYEIVHNGKDPEQAVKALIQRGPKAEAIGG